MKRTMTMDNEHRNVNRTANKLSNDIFICCRVSVPRNKTFTNSSDKFNSTSTRNRFEVLQTDEVSESVPPNIIGGIRLDPSHKGETRSHNGHTNKPKRSKSANKSQRDPNPTRDIWDQSSLNLDLLFQEKINNKFKVGIWNAESVRQKENLVK